MTKNILNNKYINLIIIFSYALIILISLSGIIFLPGTIGLRADWNVAPLYQQNIEIMKNTIYSWSQNYLGYQLTRTSGNWLGIIIGIFSVLFHIDGSISKYILLIILPLSGIFMYLLMKGIKINTLSSFLSGLVYMLSPIIFNTIITGYIAFLVSYAFLPLLFLLYIKLLDNKESNYMLSISLGIVMAVTFSQDNFILIVLIIIISYLLFDIISKKKSLQIIKRNIFSLIISISICFLLQSYFFLPLLVNIKNNNVEGQSTSITGMINAWNTFIAPSSLNAFTLDGAGYKYFTNSINDSIKPLWIFVSFLFSLIIFSTFFYINKKKSILYFYILTIISLFLFKGINSPLGNINQFIYNNLPYIMVFFRNIQYITVFTIFCYAILLGFLFDIINTKLKLRFYLYSLTGIAAIILILFNSNPFFLGGLTKNLQLYNLNSSYKYLYNKLSNDFEDYRIFWLPPVQPMGFNNSKYYGHDPMFFGSPKPSIGNYWSQPIEKMIIKQSYLENNSNIGKLLAFVNVKKIVYREDFESHYPSFGGKEFEPYTTFLPNSNLKEFIKKQKSFKLEETINKNIEVYNNSTFLPHLYLTDNPIFIEGSVSDMVKIIETDNFTIDNNAFFLSDNISKLQWNFLKQFSWYNKDIPLFAYKKINPTKYKITINNAESPFFLIFLENYNPEWKVYIDYKNDKKEKAITFNNYLNTNEMKKALIFNLRDISYLFKTPLDENKHFMVNGYANAWYIDPIDTGSGNVELVVYFKTQSYTYIGIIISFSTMISCTIYLISSFIRGLRKKHILLKRK